LSGPSNFWSGLGKIKSELSRLPDVGRARRTSRLCQERAPALQQKAKAEMACFPKAIA
jgi:hypothetical protein